MIYKCKYCGSEQTGNVLQDMINDFISRNPFWKFSSFKRVHKSKKTYNRKKKHKNDER